MKIMKALLELKLAFAEQDGEVLQFNLNKKAVEALQRECSVLGELIECTRCGTKVPNTEVLGIEIIQSESGEVFGVGIKESGGFFCQNMPHFIAQFKRNIIKNVMES